MFNTAWEWDFLNDECQVFDKMTVIDGVCLPQSLFLPSWLITMGIDT